MKVIIIRGCSGSGKSTLAKKLKPDFLFSTDNYFIINGEYKFDISKLGENHSRCLQNYIEHIRFMKAEGLVVVDNTNISVEEFSPYYSIAKAYGHDVEIITLDIDPVIAHSRNIHGLTLEKCRQQYERLIHTKIPSRFTNKTIKDVSELGL